MKPHLIGRPRCPNNAGLASRPRALPTARFGPLDNGGHASEGFHNGCFFAICGAMTEATPNLSTISKPTDMKSNTTERHGVGADVELPAPRSRAGAAWDDLAEGVSKSW